ncbi:nucleotidyltransferase family protein [Syntrophus aciditrophicus]|nr:nucleotidyltransferase family protein [Syntrophus aciditrophicus]
MMEIENEPEEIRKINEMKPPNTPFVKTAFVLGAGLGTRLRPLTETCPKPLLQVRGRPLITYALDHLRSVGIRRFIINTHHCANRYEEAFPDRQWRGIPIIFRYEPILLDTGGGLKNIEDLLIEDDRVLVYNGDILTDFPLERLIAAHRTQGKEVTLALRSSGEPANVCINDREEVCDMRFLLGNPGHRRCLFTGIYLVEKTFLRRLKPSDPVSVVPVLIDMLREQPGSVGSVILDEGIWYDIGSLEAYEEINRAAFRTGT